MFRAFLTAIVALPMISCSAQSPANKVPAVASTGNPGEGGAVTSVAAPPKVTYSQCNVEGSYVAITFDDGPHAENTPRLLDLLKKRNIKATFFLVGQCVAEYPDIMKRMVAEGHEVANHSWSHPLLSKMGEGAVSDQLQKTHDAIIAATGVTPKLMRPPYGGFTNNQRAWANQKFGYKVILWDVDPLDWKVRNASHVQHEILKQTVAGSIILSHDIHKTTVDAMPETLDALSAKGYKFVTVSELLAMDRVVAPKPKASTPVPSSSGKTPAVTVEPIPQPSAPGTPVVPAPVPVPATPPPVAP